MKSECPYCGFVISLSHPDPDVESNMLARREIAHMTAVHPDVVEERQRLADAGQAIRDELGVQYPVDE